MRKYEPHLFCFVCPIYAQAWTPFILFCVSFTHIFSSMCPTYFVLCVIYPYMLKYEHHLYCFVCHLPIFAQVCASLILFLRHLPINAQVWAPFISFCLSFTYIAKVRPSHTLFCVSFVTYEDKYSRFRNLRNIHARL